MVKSSALRIAVFALDEATCVLEGIKESPEMRDLVRQWYSLRSVVHWVVEEHVPKSLTPEQEGALMRRVLKLAEDVADLSERVAPDHSETRTKTWQPPRRAARSGSGER